MAKLRPEITGISEITGKRVSVRHAVEADIVFIRQSLSARKGALNKPLRNLDYREFVVATKDNRMVSFGRLREAGDVFALDVFSGNRNDVERLVVEHLIHIAPEGALLVIGRKKGYLKELGFREIPRELAGSGLMAYVKA